MNLHVLTNFSLKKWGWKGETVGSPLILKETKVGKEIFC
jgi:hypothetical protein